MVPEPEIGPEIDILSPARVKLELLIIEPELERVSLTVRAPELVRVFPEAIWMVSWEMEPEEEILLENRVVPTPVISLVREVPVRVREPELEIPEEADMEEVVRSPEIEIEFWEIESMEEVPVIEADPVPEIDSAEILARVKEPALDISRVLPERVTLSREREAPLRTLKAVSKPEIVAEELESTASE